MTSKFAPNLIKASGYELTLFKQFLERGNGKTLLITGAGLSTDSGIPDYRSPNGSYSRGHKPVTYQEFTTNESIRKRYWARSIFGIKYFQKAKPNLGHKSIHILQEKNFFNYIITQNVDRLQHKVGTNNILEIHGNNSGVKCLSCETEYNRELYTKSLTSLNRKFIEDIELYQTKPEIRADGDAELDRNKIDFDKFEIMSCENCGGVLMPTVVFFGGSVDMKIKEKSFELVDLASQVLVLGSSVQTFSVFRLLREANKEGKEIGIVTLGETRADEICSWKIECSISDLLERTVRMIG